MDFASLIVRPINANERELWDELMKKHHYLGFRKLVGESIRYIVLLQGKTVALLGWSSAAYKSYHRDQWIGWSEERRPRRCANGEIALLKMGLKDRKICHAPYNDPKELNTKFKN